MIFHEVAVGKYLIIDEVNNIYYQIIIFLVIVMNNRMEIAREFANAINSDKIISIILFGSVARGDDTEESDIDILIISNHREDLDDKISDEIAWIMYDKQELISAHVINEEIFNKTKNFSFLTNVLKEGVPIG